MHLALVLLTLLVSIIWLYLGSTSPNHGRRRRIVPMSAPRGWNVSKPERRPVTTMNNTAWENARKRAADRYMTEFGRPSPEGFRKIRVHDLKHTFGRRLRATEVSFADRQDLLGHKSARVTTDYSAAEIGSLIEAANRVAQNMSRKSRRNFCGVFGGNT
jgi:integrase